MIEAIDIWFRANPDVVTVLTMVLKFAGLGVLLLMVLDFVLRHFPFDDNYPPY